MRLSILIFSVLIFAYWVLEAVREKKANIVRIATGVLMAVNIVLNAVLLWSGK